MGVVSSWMTPPLIHQAQGLTGWINENKNDLNAYTVIFEPDLNPADHQREILDWCVTQRCPPSPSTPSSSTPTEGCILEEWYTSLQYSSRESMSHLSICLIFVSLIIYLSIHLPFYLSLYVCLSISLSVCLFPTLAEVKSVFLTPAGENPFIMSLRVVITFLSQGNSLLSVTQLNSVWTPRGEPMWQTHTHTLLNTQLQYNTQTL